MVKKKSLVWQNCSEAELGPCIRDWLAKNQISRSVIFLEGEMGSGKSTFVREILRVLSPKSISQGSPTFPLVQLYETKDGTPFYHIDLYRLKNEDELSDSGIESQMEEPNSIACVEWASLFPDAFAHWFDERIPRHKNVYVIRIENVHSQALGEEGTRNYYLDAY
jgi:tRNA threonylcarbamoyl adenosine modification protein YjeE